MARIDKINEEVKRELANIIRELKIRVFRL